jgi:hypothetical protein
VWQSAENEAAGDAGTEFCLGAFKDALWLCRNDSEPKPRLRFRLDSAQRCVWFLGVLAILSMTIALVVPGVRRAIRRAPYRDGNRLVLISHDGFSTSATPSVSLKEYSDWRRRRQKVFSEFAFYRPGMHSRIEVFGHSVVTLSSAVASRNLFDQLGISVDLEGLNDPADRDLPWLILSQSAWERYFGKDSRIPGSVVSFDGKRAVLAGVLAEDTWQLPGHTDAWLLQDEDALATLPQEAIGYVIGHAVHQTGDQWHMMVPQNGRLEGFTCSSLGARSRRPITFFLFALMLACLALPATTPLPLGDYPATSERFFGATRRRRWVFLSAKMVLILPIVYCGGLDLAYSAPSMDPITSGYIQLFASFAGLLFFFRWSLRDQRRRCPVCLRVLTSPARVGEYSRSFLAWNGTELICGRGHGLLHVPELSTSWFSTQRWLSLDPSWHGLFHERYLPSPGVF